MERTIPYTHLALGQQVKKVVPMANQVAVFTALQLTDYEHVMFVQQRVADY